MAKRDSYQIQYIHLYQMICFFLRYFLSSLAPLRKSARKVLLFCMIISMAACGTYHRTAASEAKATDSQFTHIAALDSINDYVADSIIRAFEVTIEYSVQNDSVKNKHVTIKANGLSITAKKHNENKIIHADSARNTSRFSHSENNQERYREQNINLKYPIILIILLIITAVANSSHN